MKYKIDYPSPKGNKKLTSWKMTLPPACRAWSLGSGLGAVNGLEASSSSSQSCKSRQISVEYDPRLPPWIHQQKPQFKITALPLIYCRSNSHVSITIHKILLVRNECPWQLSQTKSTSCNCIEHNKNSTWIWSYLLQWRSGRRLVELGLPLAKHLMNLFLEHSSINGTALLPRKLQIQEHQMQIINTVLRLVLEKTMWSRLAASLRTLLHRQTRCSSYKI